jgi:hypothetical protein
MGAPVLSIKNHYSYRNQSQFSGVGSEPFSAARGCRIKDRRLYLVTNPPFVLSGVANKEVVQGFNREVTSIVRNFSFWTRMIKVAIKLNYEIHKQEVFHEFAGNGNQDKGTRKTGADVARH